MLHADRTAYVRVPLPRDLSGKSLRLDAQAQMTEVISRAVRLQTEAELVRAINRQHMNVEVTNPVARPVEGVEIAIIATDAQRQPIARWRAFSPSTRATACRPG